jgi:hypothetical protein
VSNNKVAYSTRSNIGSFLSGRISSYYFSIVANSTYRLSTGSARRSFAPNASQRWIFLVTEHLMLIAYKVDTIAVVTVLLLRI